LAVFALVLALLPAQPRAQARLSEQEKAIFAFYHLTETGKPDFTSYVKALKRYKDTEKKYQKNVFEKEMSRMQWGMDVYNPEKDFLKIGTAVDVKLSSPSGGRPAVLSFQFPHEGKDYIPYFPYDFGGEWIALLIEDLPLFSRMELAPAQYAFIKAYLPDDGMPYPAKLHMQIRPISADNTAPFQLGGINQWLMMGDIAALKFDVADRSSQQNKTLWEYAPDWYLTGTQKELLPLLNIK